MVMNDKHVRIPALRDIPTTLNEWKRQLYLQQYDEILFLRSDFNTSGEEDEVHDKVKFSQVLEESENSDANSTTSEKKLAVTTTISEQETHDDEQSSKGISKYWPIFTAGAGLFSDGYINASIGTVSLCLSKIYGDAYSESRAIQNISSIAFVGTVVGQLLFGYLSDNYNRKFSMLLGTCLLILFSILAAGAWGVGTTGTEPGGLFAAITAYRFFLGIAIGSEYSSSSPAAAEASNLLPKRKRNRYFIWFTNFMIDFGFVVAAFVPLVLVWICGEKHLTPVWRITIGLGAIPPISLFFMRLNYKESDRFKKSKFQKHPPYWLVFKFYWFRTSVIAILWFIYDFSAYSFGTYSSIIIDHVLGKDPPLYQSLGWNVVFNCFYLPGAFLGAYLADYFGPRNTLTVFLLLQGMVGYIMAGLLEHLKKHIAGFVVIYGIFSTLGEVSGGDNIGCIASKANATPVRGQVYAISAAVGKIGAFVGSWVFPEIINHAGGYGTTKGLQAPYLVSSSLCMFAALLAYFCLPPLDPQSLVDEDIKFIEYLKSQNYDISQMGRIESDKEGSSDNNKTFIDKI